MVYKMSRTLQNGIWINTVYTMSRRLLPKKEGESKEGDKEPNPTNSKDFQKYVQLFTYLFNEKEFKKLPKRQE